MCKKTVPSGALAYTEQTPHTIDKYDFQVCNFTYCGLSVQLPGPTCIPKLQWSYNNWSQLEISTRHFALLTDQFCEAYSSESRQDTANIFDRQSNFFAESMLSFDILLTIYYWCHIACICVSKYLYFNKIVTIL